MLVLIDLGLVLVLSFIAGLLGIADGQFWAVFAIIFAMLLFFYLLYVASIFDARRKLRQQLGDEAQSIPVRVWEVNPPLKGCGWVIGWPFLVWFVWFLLWDVLRKYVTARFYRGRIDLFWLTPPTPQLESRG